MAFREKTAWITLVSTLIVYGGYFIASARTAAPRTVAEATSALSLAVVIYVVVQVVLVTFAAATAPREARAREDERERTIQAQARAHAFYVLQVAGVAVIASVYFFDKWLVANMLLAALILAELARNLFVITGYRRNT